jgi:hypothetical protein
LLRDDNAADSLSIEELKVALEGALAKLRRPRSAGGLGNRKLKFDILGLDACFMSMVEVCSELTEFVDYVIGAEGFEPEAGWPYDRFLQKIRNPRFKDKDSAADLAAMNVETYVRFYSDYDRAAGRSVDLAAIDLKKLGPKTKKFGSKTQGLEYAQKEGLTDKVSFLGEQLSTLIYVPDEAKTDEIVLNRARARREQIVLAHWEAQTYKFDQFVDLYDFCECLIRRFEPDQDVLAQEVVRAAKTVKGAVRCCVVKSGCAGFAYQHSHGLSIYFPWSQVSKDYARFQNGWHKFLVNFVRDTRRPEREGFEKAAKTEARWRRKQRDLCKAKRAILGAALKKDLGEELAEEVLKKVENAENGETVEYTKKSETPRSLRRVLGFGHRYDSSRYDSSRYDSSRYDSSRYDSSRYSNERERWAKNPPIGSGIAFFTPDANEDVDAEILGGGLDESIAPSLSYAAKGKGE